MIRKDRDGRGRSVSTSAINTSHIQKNQYTPLASQKITRSISSVIPGLNYQEFGTTIPADKLQEIQNYHPSSPKKSPLKQKLFFGSGASESLFNDTLLDTSSLNHADGLQFVEPRDSEDSFSFTKSPTALPSALKITEISPMSDLFNSPKDDAFIDHHLNVDKDGEGTNEKYAKGTNPPPDSASDILEPLNAQSVNRKNTIFKEQLSAFTQEQATSSNSISKEVDKSWLDPQNTDGSVNLIPESFHDKQKFLKAPTGKWKMILLVVLSILLSAYVFVTIFLAVLGPKDIATFCIKLLNNSERSQFLENMYQKYGFKLLGVESVKNNITVSTKANPSSKKIFDGISYSPLNSMEPKCGITASDVELDLLTLSNVTTRIRNYGMQCNQSRYILDAIQKLNLDLKLSMGVWIGDKEDINKAQLEEMEAVVRKYPRRLFDSIFIGNEVLFREDKSSSELLNIIRQVKKTLKKIGYIDLPVGTSEIGSLINKDMLDECDMIGANIHPFFGGVDVSDATSWVKDFMKYQIEEIHPHRKAKIVITEVGWPFAGGSYKGAIANPANFQEFLNSWVCSSKDLNYEWSYFEAFDEPWKKMFYEKGNTWETEWGLFTSDRQMKEGIIFPDCL